MQVWSLLEVMELVNVRGLGIYLSELQEYRSLCEEKKRWLSAIREGRLRGENILSGGDEAPSEITFEQILQTLEGLMKVCEGLGWVAASIKLNMTYGYIKRSGLNDCDWSSLSADLRNVADMVFSELWHAKIVKVEKRYSAYINSDELICEDFATFFPSTAEDIKEAGNCIAVDSGTAGVFHLMRAVEWGMRALCVDIGLLTTKYKKIDVPIEYSQWEQILNQLHPEIEKKLALSEKGEKKQEAQEYYLSLYFDIKGFKDAFRNHVSHTRTKYSQKAADDILDYVRRFFVLLKTKISE